MSNIFSRMVENRVTQSWLEKPELTKATGKTKSKTEKKISVFSVSFITAGATVIGVSALAEVNRFGDDTGDG
ncbi:hypothetical protein BKK56_09075 [Rodentibacter genomosp. 2]|uniref:hypothetical protein n=1 Tax=Rodentibacter genomosp. 2 TaxID=1908266 RepID=UPI00098630F3|nr:hypothetical protein BKK56_09075 [Rodentibacter genomosp. 2]